MNFNYHYYTMNWKIMHYLFLFYRISIQFAKNTAKTAALYSAKQKRTSLTSTAHSRIFIDCEIFGYIREAPSDPLLDLRHRLKRACFLA